MRNIKDYITESSVKFKRLEDVQKYLDQFKDNETSWRGATDEIRDMARYSREFLQEFDNIEIDPIDFRAIKTPSEWNTMGKKYILNNISQMTKSTQARFFKHLNDFFN